MAVAAHHHHVLDEDRERPVHLFRLGHIGDEVLAQRLFHRTAEQGDLAARRRHEAHDRLEQGGLAGAVDADQGGDRAARDLEGRVVQRGMAVAIGHGHVVRRDAVAGRSAAGRPVVRYVRRLARDGHGVPVRSLGCSDGEAVVRRSPRLATVDGEAVTGCPLPGRRQSSRRRSAGDRDRSAPARPARTANPRRGRRRRSSRSRAPPVRPVRN